MENIWRLFVMFEHRTDMELGNMIVGSPVSLRQLSYLLKYSHHCSAAQHMMQWCRQGYCREHQTQLTAKIWSIDNIQFIPTCNDWGIYASSMSGDPWVSLDALMQCTGGVKVSTRQGRLAAPCYLFCNPDLDNYTRENTYSQLYWYWRIF